MSATHAVRVETAVRVADRQSPRVVARQTLGAFAALVILGAVLRVVWASSNGMSFDESFTAMVGRRSLGQLLDALRVGDSHPPLDYLLRAPLARAGASDLVMRSPSLVFSVAALALFAWWMRTRGLAGLVAVAVMAVSPFQIMYGGEARMYALLELLGVAAAYLADQWLRAPRRWHEPVAAALVLLAVFDHVSGWLLALGLLAVAGWRRDARALHWRVAVASPLVLWGAVWGPSFLVQASHSHASWIDRTSWRGLADAVAGQITTQHGVALVVVAVVILGVAVLARAEPKLGRVVLCCGALPVFAAAVVGVFVPFFIDRTVTVAAWAPCLAVGFAIDGVLRRSRILGIATGLLVAALVLPATVVFVGRTWEYDASVDHLVSVVRPGDVVATVPEWYGALIDWRVGERVAGEVRPVRVESVPDSHAIVDGTRAMTGRIWVLSFAGDRRTFPRFVHCAPNWTDGITVVSCIEMPHSG